MAAQDRAVTATGLVPLSTSVDRFVSTHTVQVTVTGSPTFSFTFRGIVAPGNPTDAIAPLVVSTSSDQIAYTPAGATSAVAGSTAITAAGIWYVAAPGLTLAAHFSALTLSGGTVTVRSTPLVG